MQSSNIAIEAVHYVLPPHRIRSDELEAEFGETLDRLHMPRGQLEQLTGIEERRFWDPGFAPSEAATLAGRKLLESTDIDPARIGCLINTSVCKDYVEPSVACLVHGNLGLSARCVNYDIANACLGFLNAIAVISMMIEAGQIEYGLIVDGESARDVVEATVTRLSAPETTIDDYRRNFATLTVGSGAVAMLLTHRDRSRHRHVVNGWVEKAATEHSRLCVGQRDWMHVDASALLVAGVGLARETWKLAEQRLAGWNDAEIALYTPHQVSIRNQSTLNRALGITPGKVFLNLYTLGNIGPAALPITLAMAAEENRIGSTDHVAMMGIGSGLNCAMMSVTW